MVSLEIRFTVPENIQDLLLKIKKDLKDFQSKRLQKVTRLFKSFSEDIISVKVQKRVHFGKKSKNGRNHKQSLVF